MVRNGRGIVGYRKARRMAGLLAAAGVACLANGALAADVADADSAREIAGIDVLGSKRPMDHDLNLSVMQTTIQDTPQAISIIDASQMRAQGVTSLEQALRNVPGITVAIGEGGQLNGDQFKIRGFDAKDDVYVDGLRDFGAYTRDSFAYEEVQVLKGPSGAMFGRGTTGGAINTVSKTPKLKDFTSVDAYLGNGAYKRVLADINHQIGDTSALRANLMWTDGKVVDRDLIYNKRWGAALSAAFGVGTATQFTLNYVHQHSKGRPDYGIIIVPPTGQVVGLPISEYGVGVERSTFTGYRNDIDRNTADLLTARFKHAFNDKVTLSSDTRYGLYSRYFQYSTTDNCGLTAACQGALFDNNPATEPAFGIGGSGPYDADVWGLQNITTLRVDYDLGGFRNQLIVGADVSRNVNDKQYFTYTLPAGFTARNTVPKYLVNPNYDFPAGYTLFRGVPGQNISCPASGPCTTTLNGATVNTNVTATGVYKSHAESTSAALMVTDRLWLMDTLSVIGSLRLERYRAVLDNTLFTGALQSVKAKSTLKSPRVSAVFEPSDTQTFYLSWGRSETPQGTSITNSGTPLAVASKDLDAEVSRILEAGAKVQIPRTRMSLSASVFDVKKGNALQQDPSNPGFLLAQSGEKQRVKGFELTLAGRVAENWTINAAYAYLDSKTVESFTNCVAAGTASGTPTGVVCPVGTPTATPVRNTFIEGRPVIFVPKQSASLYTNYDASHWIEGLSVGGDVVYQGPQTLRYTTHSVSYADRSTLTPTIIARAPRNLTFDAFASYQFSAYRVGVNVYNIGNRLNYSQVFGNRGTPAAGRTVIVSLGATF